MSRLSELHEEYEQIMRSPASSARDRALSNLMDKMKAEYRIPLFQNPKWESKNKPVIALYRKISMSRQLL